MAVVLRPVSVPMPGRPELSLPSLTLCGAEGVAPLDLRIYDLARYLRRSQRALLADNADPRLVSALRKALGLRHKHARLCKTHARVVADGLEKAGNTFPTAIEVAISSDDGSGDESSASEADMSGTAVSANVTPASYSFENGSRCGEPN